MGTYLAPGRCPRSPSSSPAAQRSRCRTGSRASLSWTARCICACSWLKGEGSQSECLKRGQLNGSWTQAAGRNVQNNFQNLFPESFSNALTSTRVTKVKQKPQELLWTLKALVVDWAVLAQSLCQGCFCSRSRVGNGDTQFFTTVLTP